MRNARRASVHFLPAFDVQKEELEKMFPDAKVRAFLRKRFATDSFVSNLNQLLRN